MLMFCTLLWMPITDPVPSFDTLRQRVISARRAIRSIQIEIASTHTKEGDSRATQLKLWMDGNKLRGDRTASSQPFPNERVVHCIGCDGDDNVLQYVEKPGLLATLDPLSAVKRDRLFAAVDPRHFGHVLDTLVESGKPGFEGTFGAARDGTTKVSAVKNAAGDCWLMEWTGGPSTRPVNYSAVISPAQGYAILELTARIENAEEKYELSSKCRHQQTNGIWYPVQIDFQKKSHGKLYEQELATLRVISINQPIDPAIFTLGGVKMRDGTIVRKPGKAKSVRVKDGKPTPLTRENFADLSPPAPVADPGERRVNPWLLAVCGLLALAAGFLVVKKVRARRASA